MPTVASTDPMAPMGAATVPNTDPTNPNMNTTPGAAPTLNGGGIINGAQAGAASNYTPATLSDPTQWNVTNAQTVAGQMQHLADPNSQYYQQWAAAGAANAAQRGFTGNSSIAQTGILDSVMRNAQPIAAADAATYAKSASYNADERNQFGIQNLNATNRASEFGAGQANQMGQANIQAGTQRYGIDVGANTQRYTSDQANATQRYGTDIQAGTQRYGIDTGANTQRYTSDQANATQRYGTDIQAGTQRYGIDTGANTQRYATDQGTQTQRDNALLNSQTQRYVSDQNAATQQAIASLNTQSQQLISQAHDANAVLLQSSTDAQNSYANYATSLANIQQNNTLDENAKQTAINNLSATFNNQMASIKTAAPNAAAAGSPLATTSQQSIQAPATKAVQEAVKASGVDVSQQLQFNSQTYQANSWQGGGDYGGGGA